MYSSAHTAAGVSIALAGHALAGPHGMAAGLAAGVASHYALDLVGERPLGSLAVTVAWEAPALLAAAWLAWWSGMWGVVALGVVAGNLPDIIDKKAFLAVVVPWRFRATRLFACHRWSPAWPLTLNETRAASLLSAAAVLTASALF